jgi:cytochrome P450 family 4
LEQFVDVFESTGDILVQKLSKESGNQSVDIFPYLTLCTLDIICGEINVLKSNNLNLKQFYFIT